MFKIRWDYFGWEKAINYSALHFLWSHITIISQKHVHHKQRVIHLSWGSSQLIHAIMYSFSSFTFYWRQLKNKKFEFQYHWSCVQWYDVEICKILEIFAWDILTISWSSWSCNCISSDSSKSSDDFRLTAMDSIFS